MPAPAQANQREGVPRYDSQHFGRTVTRDTRLPRITASATATAALTKLRHDRGPLAIVLGTSCATVSVARVYLCRDFDPGEQHVPLGVLAYCQVYAESQAIEACAHDVLVIDLHANVSGREPLFVSRPESRAERQQRIFAACAHDPG